MKHRIKEWFRWYGFAVWSSLAIIIFIVGVFFLLLLGQANTYKFNCKLDHRPDFHTTFFIANDTYAYDPEFFCNHLKQEMNK